MERVFLLLADVVLFAHIVYALFVALGLPMVWAGGVLGFGWARNPWLRLAHLAASGVVAAETFFGALCPLTEWEYALRRMAGHATRRGGTGFVEYWHGQVLYADFDETIFAVIYMLFFLAVVATFWIVPVRGSRLGRGGNFWKRRGDHAQGGRHGPGIV